MFERYDFLWCYSRKLGELEQYNTFGEIQYLLQVVLHPRWLFVNVKVRLYMVVPVQRRHRQGLHWYSPRPIDPLHEVSLLQMTRRGGWGGRRGRCRWIFGTYRIRTHAHIRPWATLKRVCVRVVEGGSRRKRGYVRERLYLWGDISETKSRRDSQSVNKYDNYYNYLRIA